MKRHFLTSHNSNWDKREWKWKGGSFDGWGKEIAILFFSCRYSMKVNFCMIYGTMVNWQFQCDSLSNFSVHLPNDAFLSFGMFLIGLGKISRDWCSCLFTSFNTSGGIVAHLLFVGSRVRVTKKIRNQIIVWPISFEHEQSLGMCLYEIKNKHCVHSCKALCSFCRLL